MLVNKIADHAVCISCLLTIVGAVTSDVITLRRECANKSV